MTKVASEANAPVRLIYLVDIDKFKTAGYQESRLYEAETQKLYYSAYAGLIAQNIYLAISALGLVPRFHNRPKCAIASMHKRYVWYTWTGRLQMGKEKKDDDSYEPT
jgi:hypothetical protein